MDKTWVHRFIPESKEESKQWITKGKTGSTDGKIDELKFELFPFSLYSSNLSA